MQECMFLLCHNDKADLSFPPIRDERQKNRTSTDPVISVHQTRLELARVSPHAPQACVSTDSTTGANAYLLYPCKFP